MRCRPGSSYQKPTWSNQAAIWQGWSRMPSRKGSVCSWYAAVTAPFLLWPESWPVHAPPWGLFPSERRITRPSAWASQRISRLPSPSCERAGGSKWMLAWPTCGEIDYTFPGSLLGRAGFDSFPVCRRYPARQPGAGRRFPDNTGRFPASRDPSVTG